MIPLPKIHHQRHQEKLKKLCVLCSFCAFAGDRFLPHSPVVAPRTVEQFRRLFRETDLTFFPFGTGSSCDFITIPAGVVGLSTRHLNAFEPFPQHQTVMIGAGFPAADANARLAAAGMMVHALARQTTGSVGGRLALIPSTPQVGDDCGWIQSLLAIDVMLPNGDVLSSGSHCIKDVAGYDLRHLFTGSRGAFGVILSAVFRCRPIAPHQYGTDEPRTAEPRTVIPAKAGIQPIDPVWRAHFDPAGRLRPGASPV